MTETQIVDAFKNLNPLIVSRAQTFHGTTGVPLEELIAEARIALMVAIRAWNPDKGIGLAPYAKRAITNRLIDFAKKYHRISVGSESIEIVLENETAPVADALTHSEFRDKIAGLSEEAQFVVNILLSSRAEIVQIWGIKKRLNSMLRHNGWSWNQIWAVNGELKEAFGG